MSDKTIAKYKDVLRPAQDLNRSEAAMVVAAIIQHNNLSMREVKIALSYVYADDYSEPEKALDHLLKQPTLTLVPK